MTIKSQVCSLELAKRLKELDVKQESLYRHVAFVDYGNGQRLWSPKGWYLVSKDDPMFGRSRVEEEWCSAFTVAEILEPLPTTIDGKTMFIDRFHDKWLVGYVDIYEDDVPYMDSLANACAQLSIYLKENNLI